jgi:predicted nucleic acid-binding protein
MKNYPDSLMIDTNILIYLLNGDKSLSDILSGKNVYISFINELEILSSKSFTKLEILNITAMLNECKIIDINSGIKDTTINLRNSYKLKLPDAIIAATAIYLDIPLLTSDMDFQKLKKLELLLFKK